MEWLSRLRLQQSDFCWFKLGTVPDLLPSRRGVHAHLLHELLKRTSYSRDVNTKGHEVRMSSEVSRITTPKSDLD